LKSSTEFGPLRHCRLMAGAPEEKTERTIVSLNPADECFSLEHRETIDTDNLRYLRAECETTQGNICITNPVWISGK